jgi:hypothetical protein
LDREREWRNVGTLPWSVGGVPNLVDPIPSFTAGATVGYIPIQDNSGGSDKVLYVPFSRPVRALPPVPTPQAGM